MNHSGLDVFPLCLSAVDDLHHALSPDYTDPAAAAAVCFLCDACVLFYTLPE